MMEVDSDDDEITLKTPPNIQKIKSRSNSRAASTANTPTETAGRPKGLLEKLVEKKMMKGSTPNLDSAAQKLSKIKAKTPSTPKVKRK
jgi:hypothetical protein